MVETVKHATLSGIDAHAITRWDVVDLAARDALTPVEDDLHKVCYVQSPAAYYVLSAVTPAVAWEPLSLSQEDPIVDADIAGDTITLLLYSGATITLTLPEGYTGNAVEDVSVSGNTLTFTFRDTTTQDVVLPDGYSGNAVEGVEYNAASNALVLTYRDTTTETVPLPDVVESNPVVDIAYQFANKRYVFTYADGSDYFIPLPEEYTGNAVENITVDAEANELEVTFRDTTTARVALPEVAIPDGVPVGQALLEGVGVDATGKLALDGATHLIADYPALAAALGIAEGVTVNATRASGYPAPYTAIPSMPCSAWRTEHPTDPRILVATRDNSVRLTVMQEDGTVVWTSGGSNVSPGGRFLLEHNGEVFFVDNGALRKVDPLVQDGITTFTGDINAASVCSYGTNIYKTGNDGSGEKLVRFDASDWNTELASTSVPQYSTIVADANYVYVFTDNSPYLQVYDADTLNTATGIDLTPGGSPIFPEKAMGDSRFRYWQNDQKIVLLSFEFAFDSNNFYVLDKATMTRDTAAEAVLAGVANSPVNIGGEAAYITDYGAPDSFAITSGSNEHLFIVDVVDGVFSLTTLGAKGGDIITNIFAIPGVAIIAPIGFAVNNVGSYSHHALDLVTDFTLPTQSSGDPMLEWRIKAE